LNHTQRQKEGLSSSFFAFSLADHWGWTASLLVAALIAICGGVMWVRIDAAQKLEE
jgi:hypothetical protein